MCSPLHVIANHEITHICYLPTCHGRLNAALIVQSIVYTDTVCTNWTSYRLNDAKFRTIAEYGKERYIIAVLIFHKVCDH